MEYSMSTHQEKGCFTKNSIAKIEKKMQLSPWKNEKNVTTEGYQLMRDPLNWGWCMLLTTVKPGREKLMPM